MIADLDFRDAWLAEIALLMNSAPPKPYPPGGMPARPEMAPAKRSRIVERYGERFCAVCGFPEVACGCDRAAGEVPSADGDGSDLRRRIAEARSGR